MTDEDIGAVRALLQRNGWLRPTHVLSPSGNGAETDLVSALYGVVPSCPTWAMWDMLDPPPAWCRGDLGLVCNAFMCSTDPVRWLWNLSRAVPLLVVQDLSDASRAPGRWTAPWRGDVARFSVSSHGVVGATDPDAMPVLDLSDPVATGGAVVLDCEPYMPTGRPRSFVRFAALLDLRGMRR